MTRADPPVISAAVEGITDEAIAQRIITHVQGQPGNVYGKNGKSALRRSLPGYINAARHAPWIILVDLDLEYECAPQLCVDWETPAAPHLCFRVAVRQMESWLLADRSNLARYMRVPAARVPRRPETLDNPKRTLVDLARHSGSRTIREDMVPRAAGGSIVGPGYTGRIIDFVHNHWQPQTAARHADSLRRALNCLHQLIQTTRN